MNPVLNRELRSLHRGAFLYVLRGSYVALLCAMVLVGWKQTASRYGVSPLAERPNIPFEKIGALGRSLFELFCLGELGIMVVIGPILTARLLTEERERRTLEILVSSPLWNFEIASGKFQVGLIHLVLLIVSGTPVLGVTALLGGVSLEEIMLATAYLCCVASLASAAGLSASAVCRRTSTAVLMSYVVLAVVFIGLECAGLLDDMLGAAAGGTTRASAGGAMLNPVHALTQMLKPGSPSMVSQGAAAQGRSPVLLTIGGTLATTLLLLANIALRIRVGKARPRPVPEAAARSLRALLRSLGLAWVWRPFSWLNPHAGRYWREHSASTVAAATLTLCLLGAGWAALSLGELSQHLPGDALGARSLMIAAVGCVALVSVSAASALAKERDRRALDLARVAPRGAPRLLAALLLAPVVQLAAAAGAGLCLSLYAPLRSDFGQSAGGLVAMWASAWVFGAVMCAVAVCLSALFRSPTRAMLGTLVVLLCLCIAPFLVRWTGVLLPGLVPPGTEALAVNVSLYRNLMSALEWPKEMDAALPVSLLGYLTACLLLCRALMLCGERLLGVDRGG